MDKIKKMIKKILKKLKHLLCKKTIKIEELNIKINSLEYQLEYLKHHFNIQDMKPATGWLRETQINEVRFSIEFFNELKKLEIKPFIVGGCLLGKIRHNGFIPFDDDIDYGLFRKDFEKLEKYCKETFIWVDTNDFSGNIIPLADKYIRLNPGKYVVIKSLFCLHIYKGEKIQNALNVEFFPFDFLNDDVTEKEYVDYKKYVKDIVKPTKKWGMIFDFYKKELSESKIFTKIETKRCAPSVDHYNLTHLGFHGFSNYEDIFPIKYLEFEGSLLPFPNDMKKVAESEYGNLGWPSDVGISHGLETLNEWLRNNDEEEILYKEF